MNFRTLLGVCLCLLATASLAIRSSATEPPITSIALSPDGASLVACSQAGVQVYSWPDLKPKKRLSASSPNLHDLAFSPAGDRLAVAGGTPAEEGTVEVFAWPRGKSLQRFDGHYDSVMAARWRDDNSLASASLDHSVMVWNTRTGEKIRSFQGHSRGVSSLCFLTDNNTLVTAGIDQSLRVWDVNSGELVRSLSIHTLPIRDIALRPGDHGLPMVATASEDKTVRLWQPTIGRMVRFARLKSRPLDVEWSPDGFRIVVSCTDGHVYVIDPDTVTVTEDIPAVDGWAYAIAVHPTDGSMVVGSSDGELRRIKPRAQ